MRSWRASSSGQSFSAIFSCSACTAPEVTGGENKHDEEGDRRDARGLGPAARDAARAGGDSEYRRRGTRQTSAVQFPRRAAVGAAGRNPEQRKVRKLRQFFHQRRVIGGEVFGEAFQPRIEGVEVERY